MQREELCEAGRVDEQPVDLPQRVVPRGPRAVPVGWERLVTLDDLLDDHPGPVGGCRELSQIATRIGQPVGVVDPQALDLALVHQRDKERVALCEDQWVLDSDGGEGVDIEEPPVVQLLVAHPPVGKSVVLSVHQLGQRQVLGAGAHRPHMVVIAQDRFRTGSVEADLATGEHFADPLPQHGNQDRLVRRPVDVEQRAYEDWAPSLRTCQRTWLPSSGTGTATWLGTTSTTS